MLMVFNNFMFRVGADKLYCYLTVFIGRDWFYIDKLLILMPIYESNTGILFPYRSLKVCVP